MELNEFVLKFLPNADARMNKEKASYFRDNPIKWEIEGIEKFCRFNFSEALQNFADKICWEQRWLCADNYEKNYNGSIYAAIMCAEQPQIDDYGTE